MEMDSSEYSAIKETLSETRRIAEEMQISLSEALQLRQLVADVDIANRAFHARQAIDSVAQLRAQQVDVDAGLGEQAAHGAALLVEQRDHHVGRFDELVVLAHSQGLRFGERQLELTGQFVGTHWKTSQP